MSLANELRKDIASENITADNLQYVAKMLWSKMDPKVRADYEQYAAQYEGGDADGSLTENEADTIAYLMEIFEGRFPINTPPTTGSADAPTNIPDTPSPAEGVPGYRSAGT